MMTYNQQTGLSLIEVLVAVAVFAFGLLAIAALMANGMRMSTSTMHRSFAINQAYDMADRIRANPPPEAGGSVDYDGITGTGSGDPGCIDTGCTPAQIKDFDQFQWNTDNGIFLPNGVGTVSKEHDIYTITVAWDDDRDPDTDPTQFVFDFRP